MKCLIEALLMGITMYVYIDKIGKKKKIIGKDTLTKLCCELDIESF